MGILEAFFIGSILTSATNLVLFMGYKNKFEKNTAKIEKLIDKKGTSHVQVNTDSKTKSRVSVLKNGNFTRISNIKDALD